MDFGNRNFQHMNEKFLTKILFGVSDPQIQYEILLENGRSCDGLQNNFKIKYSYSNSNSNDLNEMNFAMLCFNHIFDTHVLDHII